MLTIYFCVTCMAKALRAADTGPFSASHAEISIRQKKEKTFYISRTFTTRNKKIRDEFKVH